jgi:hypothetical protein
MPIPQVTDRIKEAPAVALRAVFAGVGQLLMAVDKIRTQMQEQATSPAPGQQRPSAAQPPQGQADGASNVTVLPERAAPAKPGAGPGGAKAGAATKPGAAAKPSVGTKQGAAAKPAAGTKKSAAGSKSAAGAKPGAETKPAAKTKPGASAAKSGGAKLTAEAAKPAAAAAKPAAGTKTGAAAAKPAAATKAGAAAPKTKPSAPAKPAGVPATAREPAVAKPAPAAATVAPAAPIPGYDDLSVASLRARLRGLDAAGVQALLDYEKANARRDDVITMFERRLSKIENGTG